MADWLSWRTLTEARKRMDVLLDERNRIYEELKTLPGEFKREFGDQGLPAHLVIGRSNMCGGQVRWRLRGAKGRGQSFVMMGSPKSLAIIATAPDSVRMRLLEYERKGYWLNSAIAIRDREIRIIKNYLAILEMKRQEKEKTKTSE